MRRDRARGGGAARGAPLLPSLAGGAVQALGGQIAGPRAVAPEGGRARLPHPPRRRHAAPLAPRAHAAPPAARRALLAVGDSGRRSAGARGGARRALPRRGPPHHAHALPGARLLARDVRRPPAPRRRRARARTGAPARAAHRRGLLGDLPGLAVPARVVPLPRGDAALRHARAHRARRPAGWQAVLRGGHAPPRIKPAAHHRRGRAESRGSPRARERGHRPLGARAAATAAARGGGARDAGRGRGGHDAAPVRRGRARVGLRRRLPLRARAARRARRRAPRLARRAPLGRGAAAAARAARRLRRSAAAHRAPLLLRRTLVRGAHRHPVPAQPAPPDGRQRGRALGGRPRDRAARRATLPRAARCGRRADPITPTITQTQPWP